MKRMSAPPSSISVAMVWRNRWQAPRLADLGGVHVAAHQVAQVIARERLAVGGQEHRAVVGLDRQLRARLAEVLCRSRPTARSPMGMTRSFLPLPWRMVTVPRSGSRS